MHLLSTCTLLIRGSEKWGRRWTGHLIYVLKKTLPSQANANTNSYITDNMHAGWLVAGSWLARSLTPGSCSWVAAASNHPAAPAVTTTPVAFEQFTINLSYRPAVRVITLQVDAWQNLRVF